MPHTHRPGEAGPPPDTAAIRELAQQTNRTIEEARQAYQIELEALSAEARVTTFLPVLAKRQAKRRLLGR